MKKIIAIVILLALLSATSLGVADRNTLTGNELPVALKAAIDLLSRETDIKLDVSMVVLIADFKRWAKEHEAIHPGAYDEGKYFNGFICYHADQYPYLPVYIRQDTEFWKNIMKLGKIPGEHVTQVIILASLLVHERAWHAQGHRDEVGALRTEEKFLQYFRGKGIFSGENADRYEEYVRQGIKKNWQ